MLQNVLILSDSASSGGRISQTVNLRFLPKYVTVKQAGLRHASSSDVIVRCNELSNDPLFLSLANVQSDVAIIEKPDIKHELNLASGVVRLNFDYYKTDGTLYSNEITTTFILLEFSD